MSDTTEIAGTLAGLKALDEETIAALQAQLDEEIRLNAMGSEREARLMARLAECERISMAMSKDVATAITTAAFATGHGDSVLDMVNELVGQASDFRAEVARLNALLEVDGEALKGRADTIATLRAQLTETQRLLEVQLAVGDKLTAEVKKQVEIAAGLSDIRLKLEVELAALREISTAALATVKAVDFNHETRETPLKYTVPWLEIVALRKALIAAGIKTEGEYKLRDALGR